eukprot:TRINITY_DN25670_c0_g1_i1.p1 TRINITY_DN25670_c0_g1~~TRINITY_DN25670_c0_g1_i1.p1  ORF type:complete len:211 (-),score=65.95 TRINITY_DN25670_c0_g1_i1:199-831(-)
MFKLRTLSFEEKKAALLEAMLSDGSFYTLPELETMAKAYGIVPQALQDVVDSLVLDAAVAMDRTEAPTLYWAPPSQRPVALEGTAKKCKEEVSCLEQHYQNLQAELAAALAAAERPTPSEHDVSELRLHALAEQRRRDELKVHVDAFENCGFEKLAEMQRLTMVAKEAANRWADNICSIRSSFVRERGHEITERQFNDNFSLPEDFELLE